MSLYPPIAPYSHGMLDVGDGNRLYWEQCGNPHGKPAIVLHGGPGSGCTPGMRRYFDPAAYRIVLFDQRGAGRSTPHASDPATDLSSNTTHHLLRDIELLREHLGIERWLVYGGSWGSTLGLEYAERNRARVSEIVLAGVTIARRSTIDWLYRGVAPMFPEQWAKFRAGVPEPERDGDLVSAYARLLADPNPLVRTKAADDWCDWENSLVSVDPNAPIAPHRLTPEFRLGFARVVTHYFSHNVWLEDDLQLKNADALKGIRGVMIHGRLDLGAPLSMAWDLAQVWPDAELVLVQGAGHSSGDPGMPEAIVAATDRFRP
jgi:proline iminopeptidase